MAGSVPRRARQPIPAGLPHRRQVIAACAVFIFLAHLLLAQLTLAVALACAVITRLSSWRRQWLTQAEFLDRLATANLIPGPSSTEVAIFVGHLKRGWRGYFCRF